MELLKLIISISDGELTTRGQRASDLQRLKKITVSIICLNNTQLSLCFNF